MATRKTTAKPKTEEKSESVTLEHALKEEGEGRTPESIKNEGRKSDGPSKMDQATKIMEEMWDDIQAGKVKRKALPLIEWVDYRMVDERQRAI